MTTTTATTTLFGDTQGIHMTLDVKAKQQLLVGTDGDNNALYGDAYWITDSRGGNDVLTGGVHSSVNALYGDATQMNRSRGGNDVLTGGSNSGSNYLYGDAAYIEDSQGGNDVLTGGSESMNNILHGDAASMKNSQGGNDVLTGGNAGRNNILYGDASLMVNSQGGNDTLTGGNASFRNTMFGDGERMQNNATGGNDVITGGDRLSLESDETTSNWLYGDALYYESGTVVCGNDRLVSGTGDDAMWGDIAFSIINHGLQPFDPSLVTTGRDVFVFYTDNGHDTIHDFRQGEDSIALQGIDSAASFDALSASLAVNGTNTVITLGTNTITVVGVTALTADDFAFA